MSDFEAAVISYFMEVCPEAQVRPGPKRPTDEWSLRWDVLASGRDIGVEVSALRQFWRAAKRTPAMPDQE